MVVLDYEIDFPASTMLEWALYSVGAARFTTVVLGEQRLWGEHRRPGVLQIPEADYEDGLARFGAGVRRLAFVESLADRFATIRARLAAANEPAEEPGLDGADAVGHLRQVIEALADLMAFHVLNWALPLDDLEDYLHRALGRTSSGREVLMTLLVPTEPAHLSDFYEVAVEASQEVRTRQWSEQRADSLAGAIGHLQAPGLAQRTFETGRDLTAYVETLGASDVRHAIAVRDARRHADRNRVRQVARMLLSTGGSADAVAEVESIVQVCRLAAEEEEQRRRWQARSLRNARRLADRFTLDLDSFLPSECPAPVTVVPAPLIAWDSEAWAWI